MPSSKRLNYSSKRPCIGPLYYQWTLEYYCLQYTLCQIQIASERIQKQPVVAIGTITLMTWTLQLFFHHLPITQIHVFPLSLAQNLIWPNKVTSKGLKTQIITYWTMRKVNGLGGRLKDIMTSVIAESWMMMMQKFESSSYQTFCMHLTPCQGLLHLGHNI